MIVNQEGKPVVESTFYQPSDFENDCEVREAVLLLAKHFGLDFVRTNATKHGNTELQLLRECDAIAEKEVGE